ncbi:polysaccharide pyruvyl transferase family protein [Pseudomonas sp. FME51]|uniref:polysaccharide pyruvyl transferase family protein n=1 Tax=Pseudomonas sp. FME51 TaxID=2742609 RepID=UPI0018686FB0|nr:polysaccharide pyruvyl transferase family protein [Pseudomonas sp. FME51]
MKTVDEVLEAAQNHYQRIYFRPNSGNAGDSLINVGFYSIAERTGLEYEEISDSFDFDSLGERDLVILSGGGNIVPYWEGGSDLIRRLTAYPFPLLLMPQSIEGRQDVLGLLREKDVLFLREQYSYDYACSLGLSCSIKLDHDLAFSVDREMLRERGGMRLSIKNIRRMAYIAYHFVRSRFTGDLQALRTDRESRIEGKKKKINDISRLAKFGTRNRELNLVSSYWLLKVLSWYERVETDRLHVFVACVLVGTKVRLRENSYYKIRGVYDFSIKSKPDYSRLVDFKKA